MDDMKGPLSMQTRCEPPHHSQIMQRRQNGRSLVIAQRMPIDASRIAVSLHPFQLRRRAFRLFEAD
jgi:hypothetical protein